MGLRGAVAVGAVGALAVVAGARAQECNSTIAETAAGVPDLSALLDVVGTVAEDKDLAEQAGPFLQAVQDPAAEVTAFAPVNAAFAPLDGVEFNPATVLMFHAVPEMMEPGQAYDTAAGPDAGQLTIVAEGNQTTVSGPCNSANVAMTVDVCGSVVHVVDAVLLPASFCEAKDEDDEDDHDHDHDHDDDDDDDDVEALVDAEFAAQDEDAQPDAPAAPGNAAQEAFSEDGTVNQQLQSQLSGGLVSESDEVLFDAVNNGGGGGGGGVESGLDMATTIDIIADATAPAPEAPEPTDTAADDLAEMEAGGEAPEDESE